MQNILVDCLVPFKVWLILDSNDRDCEGGTQTNAKFIYFGLMSPKSRIEKEPLFSKYFG